jgi:hypothetical protein
VPYPITLHVYVRMAWSRSPEGALPCVISRRSWGLRRKARRGKQQLHMPSSSHPTIKLAMIHHQILASVTQAPMTCICNMPYATCHMQHAICKCRSCHMQMVTYKYSRQCYIQIFVSVTQDPCPARLVGVLCVCVCACACVLNVSSRHTTHHQHQSRHV